MLKRNVTRLVIEKIRMNLPKIFNLPKTTYLIKLKFNIKIVIKTFNKFNLKKVNLSAGMLTLK